MDANGEYQYLKPKRGSRYRQLFFGRIRAEVLYRETVGREPLTPQEVASEYNVPLEAVLEAIDYCVKNKDLLDAERARAGKKAIACCSRSAMSERTASCPRFACRETRADWYHDRHVADGGQVGAGPGLTPCCASPATRPSDTKFPSGYLL